LSLLVIVNLNLYITYFLWSVSDVQTHQQYFLFILVFKMLAMYIHFFYIHKLYGNFIPA